MENILSSPAEVKGIIEAVNLKTFTRFTYLKGKNNLYKFPFAVIPDGLKDIVFTPEGLIFDGADPDVEIILTDPPDVPPGDPLYAGDPTLSFERPVRPGEVDDLQLMIWRARAAQAANPLESYHEEIPRQAPRRDNVIQLPVAEKQAAKHNRPPRDVLKYASLLPIGEEWKSLYIVMYRLSCYVPLNKVGGYAGKSTQKGRYFTQGNEELARSTGLGLRTVSKYLMKMKKLKLILQHKRGYKGQWCSIWEVPFDLAHVFAWKRSPKRSR